MNKFVNQGDHIQEDYIYEEERNASTNVKPEDRKLIRSHNGSWEDNIKIDLTKIWCENVVSIHVARDKV
jgi:hypothetical protein